MKQKPLFKGIKDVFYETRVLMGREYTLKRFASEVLGGMVEPVMLSYIEKGKRFPTEALVERLAKVRGETPEALLVYLWQDRILYAFSRELKKAIKGQKKARVEGIEEGEQAFLINRAIAALPDDGSWKKYTDWQDDLNKASSELQEKPQPQLIHIVIDILKEKGLIELADQDVRRLGRHYVAEMPDEKQTLAMEFCGIFTKALLNKVVKKEKETYLRNHYLQIPEDKIEAFYKELNDAAKMLAEKYASDEGDGDTFLNVLITSAYV